MAHQSTQSLACPPQTQSGGTTCRRWGPPSHRLHLVPNSPGPDISCRRQTQVFPGGVRIGGAHRVAEHVESTTGNSAASPQVGLRRWPAPRSPPPRTTSPNVHLRIVQVVQQVMAVQIHAWTRRFEPQSISTACACGNLPIERIPPTMPWPGHTQQHLETKGPTLGLKVGTPSIKGCNRLRRPPKGPANRSGDGRIAVNVFWTGCVGEHTASVVKLGVDA